MSTSTNHSVISGMMCRNKLIFILLLGLLTIKPLAGLQEVPVFPEIGAQRVTQPPIIDGVLDEDVWMLAPSISEFVQQEPSVGSPATEKTQVKLLYDDDALYLGVRAFDSDVDGVVSSEMRRDSDRILDEDYFALILDTFKDSRSGYMFVVSPLGAKLEQQVFEEGEGGRPGWPSPNINRNWDGVWEAGTRITEEGWTAEIAIPMVTIRFPEVNQQIWGANFKRNIRRKNEQVYWSAIPQAYDLTRVSLAGNIVGMEDLSRGMDLRVKPFLVAGGSRKQTVAQTKNASHGDVGLDLKYGVTAGLNLDITVNTDFAQAEVDDERINLTRFPLFFPEKREFFLENAGQFNIGAVSIVGRTADLFFSRRIGLTPTGDQVPILAGARMTGKIGRNNIALMDIQTDEAFGKKGDNFFVARYSRDVMGRSKIGGMVINKETIGGTHFNRTFAADMTLVPKENLTVQGFLSKTDTPGMTGEDLGSSLHVAYLDRNWNVYGSYLDLGDNFNPEVGFVPRNGIRTSKVHFEPTPRPGRLGIRILQPMINLTHTTDQNNRLVTRRIHYMLGMGFESGASAVLMYNASFERLDKPFAVAKDVAIPVGDYDFGDWRFMYNTDPSRRVYATMTYSPQTFFDGTRTDVDLKLGIRLGSRLSTEGQYVQNKVDLPAGDFKLRVGALKIDYALSPVMTLRTITQYNSLTKQWSTSARFNYIYRPGSDIYLVFDELSQDWYSRNHGLGTGLESRNRRILLKFTYLLSR
jgi:hypothetical protein